MLNLLLIGNGRWGQNYIKTLNNFPNVALRVANRDNWKQMVLDSPDGVIISTPPESHVEIALHSLSYTIPTIIEKPLSLSLSEAKSLLPFQNLILVNNIHLFSEAYHAIKNDLHPNKIAEIMTNGFGVERTPNCSPMWDYGWHDIAWILDLIQKLPTRVFASKINELTQIKLYFDMCITSSLVGHHISAARDLKVISNGITLFYDDRNRPSYHQAPLTTMLQEFISIIGGKKSTHTGIQLSLNIIKVLQACDDSIVKNMVIEL